jgi:KUP system potassium uptake protein
MVITTILAFFVARRFGWNPVLAGALALGFLMFDLAFFGSNLFKFMDGGWYPVAVASVIFVIIVVWRRGMKHLRAFASDNREPIEAFLKQIAASPPRRVPGTAIYLTSSTKSAPLLLTYMLEHNQVLHERIVLLTVVIEDVPRVPSAKRIKLIELKDGFYRIVLHYGFMQSPNVPVALRFCEMLGLQIDPDTATFVLGHEDIIPARDVSAWKQFETQLFAFLWRNATRATAYYNIPTERVVAIALQVEF